MTQTTIMMLLSGFGVISTILLGWMAQNRMVRQNTRNDAGSDAALKTDVDYIKRAVDDMRLEQRAQGQRFDQLAERVTRVEEAAKQAYQRLDRIELTSKQK